MIRTFADLSPETDETTDVSVIPDTGNNIDLTAIVQRLDDMAAQIKTLSEQINGKPQETTETETTETTEKESETE